MNEVTDVVVVGGGPVGAAAALALHESGLGVTLIEARSAAQPVNDFRPLALSYGSRLILERLGVWDALGPATAIDRIHVSQRGGFGRVAFSARQARLPALGYVVDYSRLHAVLDNSLRTRLDRYVTGARMTAISHLPRAACVEIAEGGGTGKVEAKLVVIADGGASQQTADVKVVDYGQSALTTIVATELPHGNTAFERFTSGGPLALLPCGDAFAVVWTANTETAQKQCKLSSAEFLKQLQQCFGGRLGRFTEAGPRSLFPLALRYATRISQQRTVLIGNAAQTLHPVAGQGFNLGLRDAWELAQVASRYGDRLIGEEAMLHAYRTRRRVDRGGGVRFTDSLVKLFSNDMASLALARGVGLTLLGCVPPARDFVVRRMTFGARG